MRKSTAVAGACVGLLLVSGCSSSTTKSSGKKVAGGVTFRMAMTADPGNLDPQASATSNVTQISQFAYDRLVNADRNGKIVTGIATSWKVSGRQVVLTLNKSVTCSDGSHFTAADAAKNINYVADPKSKSPLLGVYLAPGAHASADVSAGTVTMTTPQVAPFALDGLAQLPMVCGAALTDRKELEHATMGTGPYKLTESVSGDHYTFTKRAGYTWGPGGVSTSRAGLPAKIQVKIIPNETTAANLLLSGGLNAATIYGPDATRLAQAKLFSSDSAAVVGEMWFNQAKGRPGADSSVRMALTKTLDFSQLRKVLTSGQGAPATELAASAPVSCTGNSVKDALPPTDLERARQLLDQAGWAAGSGGVRSKGGKQLRLTFVYNSAAGAAGSAAATLAVDAWKELGAKVTVKPQDETAIGGTLFSTGDWDIVWEPVNVGSPDQLVPFLSGPATPKGTNFASIDNAAYNAGVRKAAAMPGHTGCAAWLKAESHVISSADVLPFANSVVRTFGKDASFDAPSTLTPTSIRMQSK